MASRVAIAVVTLAGAFALVALVPIHDQIIDGIFGIGLGVIWLVIVAALIESRRMRSSAERARRSGLSH